MSLANNHAMTSDKIGVDDVNVEMIYKKRVKH
jgi:hypothetical protein